MNNDRLANSLEFCRNNAQPPESTRKYIYFVECMGFIKIGVALDVKTRINQMQTGCPFKLTLIRHYKHANAEWATRLGWWV